MCSPEACAIVALDNGCDNFMFSHDYKDWGCRCCANPDNGPSHMNWNVYTVDTDLAATKKEYYHLKAKHDTVVEIIDAGKDKILDDELKVHKVKLNNDDKK
jgi:hypothetical protein